MSPPGGGRGPDPLGKRALFWVPSPSPPAAGDPEPIPPGPLGKRALFSNVPADGSDGALAGQNPATSRGMIVVTCGTCRAVRRIGVLDFLMFQFPIGFWLPRGRFDRRMTCPACRRRVWASVTLRRV